jgi:ribonuclease T
MNQASDSGLDKETPSSAIANRFRGFLPVVIDVETGGFNPATDALLEIAAVMLHIDESGDMTQDEPIRFHVKPFPGAVLEPASLEITGIDPFHPLRVALDEEEAVRRIFKIVRREVKEQACTRAILVGHNAFFDLNFLNAAVERTGIKRNPFHPFSSFDTATLAGVALGQTVLSRSVAAAGFSWDDSQAHSAAYDASMTAKLFCEIVNRFRIAYER